MKWNFDYRVPGSELRRLCDWTKKGCFSAVSATVVHDAAVDHRE